MSDGYVAISEISLTRKEMQLLTQICSGAVYLSKEILPSAQRSEHFGLAAIEYAPVNGTIRLGDPSSKGCRITERGKDFIAYKKQRSKEWKIAFITELFFTLVSAICGALLSEPLWAFLREILAKP